MRTLKLFLLLISFNMGNIGFQNFIGKDIEEFTKTSNLIVNHNVELNKYNLLYEINLDFFGKSYNNISITTDNKGKIKDITFYIHGIIDKDFYDDFINTYNLPDDILVIDFEKVVSESKINEGLEASVKDHIFFLKKGNFEDKPQYIIWNKIDYQIRLFLRYDINISEIKFTLPTNKF